MIPGDARHPVTDPTAFGFAGYRPDDPAGLTGEEPMLPDPSVDTSEYSWQEAALPGAVRPPVDVRVELDDLCDESPRIRRSGARALLRRRQRYPAVVAALQRALTDPDAEVRGLSAQALADLDITAAVEPIRKLLADPASIVRWQAAEALSKLGDTASLPHILGFIQDVPRWVRRLCESGRPEVLPMLARALEIGDAHVRSAVSATLLKLGVELDRRNGAWHYRLRHDRRWQPV